MDHKKTFYVTTPIYYASGNIHIGHTYCNVCADTIARYKRMMGYDVRFMTGSDEHGEKIQKKALDAGLSPKEYVDRIAASFQEVWKAMNISYDYYVRTTDDSHVACVQKVFTELLKKGDIYLGKYEGWYCTPCESFFTDSQVGEEHLCPDCHRPVHWESEDSYFLNVKKFVPDLMEFYDKHPSFCRKDKLNEMINTFIKPGLDDLCITRTSFDWGVPIAENPKHIVYVWIDALLNYVSALGYETADESLMRKYWGEETEIVQLAGRDINRFHTIYWPILLMALGLRQPDRILVHGLLLTKSGVKLSKSLGNAPSPYPLIERYGVDSLRYYMVREMQFGEDGAFTPMQFVDRLNADLANNYGNLVNRTLSMVNRYFEGRIPSYRKDVSERTRVMMERAKELVDEYVSRMNEFDITGGTGSAMELLGLGSKYFDDMAPWNLSKEGKTELLEETLYSACELIRIGSILLSPVMPEKTKEALDQENVPEELRTFESIAETGRLARISLRPLAPLFPRLKKEEEIQYLTKLIDGE